MGKEVFIKNFSCEYEDLFAQLSNCLAHEYFHFLHNFFVGSSFSKRGRQPFSTDVVKESLADFFALVYSLFNDDPILECPNQRYAAQRYNSWVKRYGSSWPYAYALCFYYNDCDKPVSYSDYYKDYYRNGCRNKFMQVLETSKKSMQEAFNLLINS